MPLQLEIVSEHREMVGDDAVREFYDEGGTIGRSLQNDWILPDPDRYISSKHAAIDCRGGIYYLVDLSSNGVFINEDKDPIGKGNTQRLFNGDRLRLGDFRITVSISEGESLVMPFEDDQAALPEPIEQSVAVDRIESGIKLLDEDELAGDNLNDLLFSDSDSVATSVESLEFFEEDSSPAPLDPTLETEHEPVRVGGDADPALDAFLEGLGLKADELDPETDPGDILRTAGEVLRESIEGITRLIASRANLKTAFRLDQTIMLPRHNNPIKLSDDTNELLRQLLVGREGEFLGPREAMREVCRDLLFHQDAFLDAMTAAFDDFSDRFDPDELAGVFGDRSGVRRLFGLGASNKNWEMYCDIYPALTEKGGGRFPQLFAEEFVRSYEQQIAEFKRLFPGEAPYPPKLLQGVADETLAYPDEAHPAADDEPADPDAAADTPRD